MALSKTLDPGYLWLHLPEPSYGPQAHNANSRLQPYSRIAPSKWAVAVSAYLSDMEKLTERLKPGKKEPTEPKNPWRPKPKAKPKADPKTPAFPKE